MRKFPFVTVDVFASRPLEGNQLAVFTDARGLSDVEMQAIAREMRFSETTFVIPRDAAMEREHGIKVRIFTIVESCRSPDIQRSARRSLSRTLTMWMRSRWI